MGLVVAAVLLLPVGIPTATVVAADPQLLLLAGITAVLSSVIPYSFELAALRRLPQRGFGVLLSLEPAFATLAGWLILGQDASPLRLLAIALVVAASIGTTLGIRRARRRADDAEPRTDPATDPATEPGAVPGSDRRNDPETGVFTAPIPLPD
jgi:inner membrane transporter RhtA